MEKNLQFSFLSLFAADEKRMAKKKKGGRGGEEAGNFLFRVKGEKVDDGR